MTSYETLLELLRSRQSTRAFSPRPVDRDTAKKLVLAAQQAPSSCNHQMNRFVLVDDPELKRQFCDRAGASPAVRDAPLSIVLLFRMGWNHSKFAVTQSLGMAAQNILLAATSLGLKSVVQAGIGNTDLIRQLLGIGDGHFVASIISVGYADEAEPRAPRLPLDDVYGFNAFHDPLSLRFPRRDCRTIYTDYSNSRSPDAVWDPDRWPIEALATFRGLSVWHTAPAPGVHHPRRLAAEFESEIALYRTALGPGTRTLEFLPYSAVYGARLAREPELGSMPWDVFELSPYHEEFIRKRCELEGVRGPDRYFSAAGFDGDLGGRYDRILIPGSLNHVPLGPAVIGFLERHLAPDGRLLVCYRNARSFLALQYRRMKRAQVWNFGPFKPIAPGRFRRATRAVFTPDRTVGISLRPDAIGRIYEQPTVRHLCRTVFCVLRRA
ncbi:MAG: nitroreductase family protein [Candidatus Binatia bacterium]